MPCTGKVLHDAQDRPFPFVGYVTGSAIIGDRPWLNNWVEPIVVGRR